MNIYYIAVLYYIILHNQTHTNIHTNLRIMRSGLRRHPLGDNFTRMWLKMFGIYIFFALVVELGATNNAAEKKNDLENALQEFLNEMVGSLDQMSNPEP